MIYDHIISEGVSDTGIAHFGGGVFFSSFPTDMYEGMLSKVIQRENLTQSILLASSTSFKCQGRLSVPLYLGIIWDLDNIFIGTAVISIYHNIDFDCCFNIIFNKCISVFKGSSFNPTGSANRTSLIKR